MYKTQLKTLTIAFIIFFINSNASICQTAFSNYNIYEEADQLYESLKGTDHELINGRLLMPSRMQTYSHPYLGDNAFRVGEIIINDRHFRNICLKYDILDQLVILEFTPVGSPPKSVILNNEFIREFTIEDKHFVLKELPEQEKRFLQELKSDSLTCYYFFYKTSEEKPEGKYFVKNIHTTKVIRYLKKGGKFLKYRSNLSFIKKFDDKYKKNIKKYIKSKKLNVKSISDKNMEDLLTYCETLLINK